MNTVGRDHFLWPVAPSDRWMVTATWEQDDEGAVRLAELNVKRQGEPPPLTPELLAEIGTKLERERQRFVDRLIAAFDEVEEEIKLRAAALAFELQGDVDNDSDLRTVTARGMVLSRWDLDRLTEVATIYAKAHSTGAAPTQAVADHYGVPRGTATTWVRKARQCGLLDPASGPMARSVTVRPEIAQRAERAKKALEQNRRRTGGTR